MKKKTPDILLYKSCPCSDKYGQFTRRKKKKKKGFTYTHFQTDTFFCFFCWTCGAFLFSFLCPCLAFWAFFVVAGLAAFFDLFLVVAYRIKIKIC